MTIKKDGALPKLFDQVGPMVRVNHIPKRKKRKVWPGKRGIMPKHPHDMAYRTTCIPYKPK